MLASCTSTLGKEERICSKKQIDQLFGGGCSKSMTAFPIRVVYALHPRGDGNPQTMLMVSVSKRHFKHAVHRNRIKRQLREAYRKHKGVLYEALSADSFKGLSMAFLWLDDRMYDSLYVEKRMCELLNRIKEKV